MGSSNGSPVRQGVMGLEEAAGYLGITADCLMGLVGFGRITPVSTAPLRFDTVELDGYAAHLREHRAAMRELYHASERMGVDA